MKKAVVLLLILCLAASGCTGVRGSATATPYLPLDASVQQLDPQIAQDKASVTVLQALFEGLTRIDADGTVSPAAATWTISPDGCTYTFTLLESYWCCEGETGRVVTAQDFVYGFRRTLDPATDSALAEQLYVIKDAEAFHRGQTDRFGAQALDARTLQIELAYPDETFLQRLAGTAFFPCNEEFFLQTAGRYGMTVQTVCSNGAFTLSAWTQKQLRLKAHTAYHDADAYHIPGVRFIVSQDAVADLKAGNLDAAWVTQSPGEGYRLLGVQDTVLCLLFNHQRTALAQDACRLALLAASEQVPETGFLPPDTVLSGSESFRKSDNAVQWPSTQNPRESWADGLQQAGLQSTPRMTLLCTQQQKQQAEQILQLWQKNLSVYFSLETVDAETMQKRLQSGRYDIALAVQTPQQIQAAAQLSVFADADANPCRYADAAFAQALIQPGDRALLQTLEQRLAEKCVYVPLQFVQRCLAVSNDIQYLQIRPFGGGIWQTPYDLRSIRMN